MASRLSSDPLWTTGLRRRTALKKDAGLSTGLYDLFFIWEPIRPRSENLVHVVVCGLRGYPRRMQMNSRRSKGDRPDFPG